MQIVLDLILPLFGVVLAGFAAARMRVFGEAMNQGLSRFVFSFAIPLALFRALARAELPRQVPWDFLVSYFGGAAFVCLVAAGAARLMFGAKGDAQAIIGMGASYSNNVLLGVPLVLLAFGDEAALPLFLIIAAHALLFFSSVSIWIEAARAGSVRLNRLPQMLVSASLQNPVMIGLLAGLAWNLLGLPLWKPLDDFVRLIGSAGVPCALFALGASLAAYGVRGSLGPTALMVGLKLVVFPAVFWVLAVPVFALPPLFVAVGTLLAALPTGINAYVFAARFQVAEAPLAGAIFLSTALSFVTLSLLLGWLGP